jgi:glycosyltransferase involved in cell wall biosynthesis
VTLCVSTRNAAGQLPGCIESVRDWVSEIVVVDMESSDDTVATARGYGATVVEVPAAGWAEPGRQAGLDAATQPWVLILDADERAGRGLRETVRRYLEQDDVAGVWLPRQNFQFGWWVPTSGIWPDWQLRLVRRASASWPDVWTHSRPHVAGRCVYAPADPAGALTHDSFGSIRGWIASMNRYTDIEADQLERAGRRASLLRLLGTPTARFSELYIWRRGYRSGRYGLTVALLSFCYWLLAELKLWERRLDPARLPAGSVPLSDPSRRTDR